MRTSILTSFRRLLLTLCLVGAGMFLALLISSRTAGAAGQTVVTLGFDDGTTSQYTARSILNQRGLKGVFYVSSGRIGTSGYMPASQIRDLQNDGHEIGGHTITHPDLPTLSSDNQRKQICNDRVALSSLGFLTTSFAYPFGSASQTTEAISYDCGYNSARGVGGIVNPNSCFGCPYAESVPPLDPYYTVTPSSIKNTTTLETMKGYVTQAEQHGGGWVQLVFHHICSSCGTYAVTPANLSALADWLVTRQTSGTVVRTADQVVGGPVKPPVSFPPSPSPSPTPTPSPTPSPTATPVPSPTPNQSPSPSPTVTPSPSPSTQPTPTATPVPSPTPTPIQVNVLKNASLETDANGDQAPDCWLLGGFGTNAFKWTRVTDAHDGIYGEKLEITSLTDGNRKLVSVQDGGLCAPAAVAGQTYRFNGWYKSTVPVIISAYYRDGAGRWVWWAQSPSLPATAAWRLASWTTPPLPAGATHLSIGMTLPSVGSLTMDDFSLVAQ